MSDGLRLFLQLAANILGCGFVIAVGALQLSEFFVDKHVRHIFAAAAWFMLVPVLVLRIAATTRPPLLERQLIVDGGAIGWAVCLLFGLVWGFLRLRDNYKAQQARQRLQADTARLALNEANVASVPKEEVES